MSNQSFVPVGVPRDYPELLSLYHSDLEAASKRSGLSCEAIVTALQNNRVVEQFDFHQHVPDTFDRKAVLDYVGLSSSQWTRLLAATEIPGDRSLPDWKRRPLRVDGDGGYVEADDPGVLYWAPDVVSLRESLGQYVPVPRPICPCIGQAFQAYLATTISGLLTDRSDLVSDLPRDSEELQALYGEYVISQVRRISKIRTDEEIREVVQHIWTVILGSDVLGKFLSSAQSKLPRTLTLEESLGYLGITRTQWVNAVAYRRQHKAWVPISVGKSDEDPLYLTSDIQALDEDPTFLRGRRVLPKRLPEASSRGFKAYLNMSICNHFKNLLRTRSRRHKERCLDATTTLVPSSLGYRRTYSEDAGPWEDSLVSTQSCDMESMLDLATALRRKGIDPLTNEGHTVLDFMTRRGMTINMAVRSASQG